MKQNIKELFMVIGFCALVALFITGVWYGFEYVNWTAVDKWITSLPGPVKIFSTVFFVLLILVGIFTYPEDKSDYGGL